MRIVIVNSILSRSAHSQVVNEPFPYLHVCDALDPAYYGELAASFPSASRIAGAKPLPNNEVFRLPGGDVLADRNIPAIWRDFFKYHSSPAFFREVMAFWRDVISRTYPDLEKHFGKPLEALTCDVRHYEQGRAPENLVQNMRADVMMDTQFVINSPVTSISTVRGPHLDKPYKLFASILYMRHPDDTSTGGDLLLYRYRDHRHVFDRRQHLHEQYVEPFALIPYRANTLIMWPNTPYALHGVTPRSVTDVPRRYINFLAECYRLRTETFFSVPRSLPARVHDTAKRLLRRRKVLSAVRSQSGS
jgi:hypothetical protein